MEGMLKLGAFKDKTIIITGGGTGLGKSMGKYMLELGANLVITSRKMGEAVARNRARRLLREAFRLHQHDLRCPVDLVLVARNSIVGKKLAGVEHDFLKALRQAKLLKATV